MKKSLLKSLVSETRFPNSAKTVFFMLVSVLTITTQAKVVTEKVDYKDQNQTLEGFIVYDTAKVKPGKTPAVVIVHDWMGVGPYVKMRAEQMAGLGYVAFVADIYGKDTRPKDGKEAGAFAQQYRGGDRKNFRSRLQAAYDELKKNKFVDANKMNAMGYCFGGTGALEMARMGLPLRGSISFHGGLTAVNMDDAKNIKSKVLVLHGAIDPYVKADEVAGFQKEMDTAQVDYQFVAYSGAVHSFTHKDAGTDIKTGAAYNEAADRRSFIAMKNFLDEVNK